MKPCLLSIGALLFACFNLGCATIMNNDSNVDVTVTTEPETTEIWANEQKITCKSPCTFKVNRKQKTFLKLKAPGYKDQVAYVRRSITPWFWVTIGFCPGMLILNPYAGLAWCAGAIPADLFTKNFLRISRDRNMKVTLYPSGEPVAEPTPPPPPPKAEPEPSDLLRRLRDLYPNDMVYAHIRQYFGELDAGEEGEEDDESELEEVKQGIDKRLIEYLKRGETPSLDDVMMQAVYDYRYQQ